ncbi:hypothetical protein T484DRAFT_1757444 [Baffinella frigidus]|nr:hypothetical protein T484DRAFT_1757444 [Cryptophyta sp. CCMP2293]
MHTASAHFSEKRKQDDSAPTPPFNKTKKTKKTPTVTMSMDDDTTSTEMEEEEIEDCDDDAKEKTNPTGQKLKCTHPGCDKSRRRPNELQWHVDFAHNKIFHNVCHHIIDEENGTTCGFKSERPHELEKHKRLKHSEIRPYKCTDCSKTFKHADVLKQHKQNKHSQLRPYKCKDCPETFKQTSARDEHWAAKCSPIGHPARSRYKCKVCKQGFPTTSNCNDHYFHKCAPKDDPEREAFLKRKRKAAKALYAGSKLVRVKKALRDALKRLLKTMGMGKTTRSEEMLGCAYDQLIAHLNDNDRGLLYGDPNMVLHIDHIRPMASFKNLGCRLEMRECANFNNLQLLPGPENQSKGGRFTPADQAAYAISKGGMAIAELVNVWRAAGVCSCEKCA